MSSSPKRRPRVANPAKFLVLGLIGTVLLAVPTVGLPLLELNRAEHATLEIADDSQEGTFQLGQVGEQLARMRIHALLPGSKQEMADIEQLLDTAVAALPANLDPPALQLWLVMAPAVEQLRRTYREAAVMTRAGQSEQARALVSPVRNVGATIHDDLDRLTHIERDSVIARLREAHRETRWIGISEILLFSLFLAGTVALWTVMIRMLRRQAKQLADYTHQLETANDDLDSFAGHVAHDLRNALGPIVMAPSMLRESPADTGAVLEIADVTERRSMQAVAVMDALLAFSRASRSAEPDEASRIKPIVRDVVAEFAPLTTQLDITIDVGPIPDVAVHCSEGLLHIVLANLCGNGIKFLEGRERRHLQISAAIEGSDCKIEVEDSGPGIPAGARDKIFEPFFRVTGGPAASTGIGLATVQRIVEARDGHVEVDSPPGRGGRFRIWLPLVTQPVAQREAS
jgi:signal transduction histidine kinase